MDVYDFVQNQEIYDAKDTARRASTKANSLHDEVDRLQKKLDKVCLINQALWELIREHTGLQDDQLLERMTEIDARDGQIDGKMGSAGTACPSCGRMMSKKQSKCLYCGYTETNKEHVFHI